MKYTFSLFFCLSFLFTNAQTATLYGSVIDNQNNETIIGATIIIIGTSKGDVTNSNGHYELSIPAGKEVIIEVSYVNYNKFRDTVTLQANEKLRRDYSLELQTGETIVVTAKRTNDGMLNEGVKALELLPIASGNLESALPTLFMGVAASNELSSQYSVRGGN
jgi:hypothetical protein